MDQLSKQEHRELKRQKKEELRRSQKRKKGLKKYVAWLVSIFAIVLIVYGFKFIIGQSKVSRLGISVAIQGRSHISENATTPIYNSNPPTSGPHAGAVGGGFYRNEIKDINAVHNLEHGFIWITYKNLDSETIAKLKRIGQEFSGSVIISPREANDSSIALASWGRLGKMTAFDGGQILNFIRKNKNQSPERFAK